MSSRDCERWWTSPWGDTETSDARSRRKSDLVFIYPSLRKTRFSRTRHAVDTLLQETLESLLTALNWLALASLISICCLDWIIARLITSVSSVSCPPLSLLHLSLLLIYQMHCDAACVFVSMRVCRVLCLCPTSHLVHASKAQHQWQTMSATCVACGSINNSSEIPWIAGSGW